MAGGGEGIYALKNIPEGTLVAMFNGIKYCLVSNPASGLGRIDLPLNIYRKNAFFAIHGTFYKIASPVAILGCVIYILQGQTG